MPEVSRFYGITIRFYYRDHPPMHFHAIYAEHEALIEIETDDIYEGCPKKLLNWLTNGASFTLGSSRKLGKRAGRKFHLPQLLRSDSSTSCHKVASPIPVAERL